MSTTETPLKPADRLRDAFVSALELPPGTELETLEIGKHPQWDSLGHMALVAELEEKFGISLETDHVVEMSSYAKTIEILRGYGVEV